MRSVVYYYARHLGNLVFHAVKSCLKYERIYQEKTLFQTNLDSNEILSLAAWSKNSIFIRKNFVDSAPDRV
jgi:hypothetical protein